MYDREATLAVRIKKAQKEDLSHVPELAPTLVDDVENDAASPAKPNQPKERKMGLYMSIGLLVFITPVCWHLARLKTLAHEALSWLLSLRSSW